MADMPIRIQLSRKRGWKMPPNTVKVDRSTKWGNPFLPTDVCVTESEVYTKGEPIGLSGAVIAFRRIVEKDLKNSPAKLKELRGKNLACWCALDQPCHADILLELANRTEGVTC